MTHETLNMGIRRSCYKTLNHCFHFKKSQKDGFFRLNESASIRFIRATVNGDQNIHKDICGVLCSVRAISLSPAIDFRSITITTVGQRSNFGPPLFRPSTETMDTSSIPRFNSLTGFAK